MSHYNSGGSKSEFQPGSNGKVLRNLLGITSVLAMHDAEFDALVRAKDKYYETIEDTTVFTVELIRKMHRDWLGGIYPFAGKLRTIDLTAPEQGDIPAFRFSHAAYLETNLAKYEQDHLRVLTPCRAVSRKELSRKLAIAHAEFIVIHPFREGNGRIDRWVTELLSLQAGFPSPDHGFSGSRGTQLRQEYYRAVSVALHKADYGLLERHFDDAVQRGERAFRPRRRT